MTLAHELDLLQEQVNDLEATVAYLTTALATATAHITSLTTSIETLQNEAMLLNHTYRIKGTSYEEAFVRPS